MSLQRRRAAWRLTREDLTVLMDALDQAGAPVAFGHQQTVGRMFPSSDPAPQLVKLAQAEPLGMLYHKNCGIGNVDTDLDHRS